MVAMRDTVVAKNVAEMAALGWFPYEFIVYGCCYIECGKLYYKVSSQDTELYHFKEECLKKNIYVSPIVELLNRVSVPSGMQDEYMLNTKIMLAKQLQREYDIDFMKRFSLIAEKEGNDYAAKLLFDLKHKLLGCFDREVLALAESIIDYAFQQKKLKKESFKVLREWLEYIYSQMENDVVVYKNFKRIFYGFGYKSECGKVRYFVNASEGEVYKKREELYCNGIISTPILKKKYYFNAQPNLANVKSEFLETLERWMDAEYWWYLDSIDAMPSFITNEQFERMLQCNSVVEEYVSYYKCMWRIE